MLRLIELIGPGQRAGITEPRVAIHGRRRQVRVNVRRGAVAFRFEVRVGDGQAVGVGRSPLFRERLRVSHFLLRIRLQTGGRIVAKLERRRIIGIDGEQALRDFRRFVITVIGDIEPGQGDLLVVRGRAVRHCIFERLDTGVMVIGGLCLGDHRAEHHCDGKSNVDRPHGDPSGM